MAMTEWSEQAQAVHDYLVAQDRAVSVEELQVAFPQAKMTAIAHGIYLYRDAKEDVR